MYLCRFQNRITHKPRALQKEYKKTTGISQYPSHIVENLPHILKQSAIDERHEKPFSGEKSEHFRVNIGLRFARKQVLAASYPNRYSRRMSSNFNGTFLPFHDLNFHFYRYVRHRHIAHFLRRAVTPAKDLVKLRNVDVFPLLHGQKRPNGTT